MAQIPSFYQSTICDEQIYLSIPESELISLANHIWEKSVTGPAYSLNECWCELVFVMITWGGICGTQALKEICSLRFKDVIPSFLKTPYILINRMGGYIPVFIHTTLAVPLIKYLVKRWGRQFSDSTPASIYLMPGIETEKDIVDVLDQRFALFNGWLDQKREEMGLKQTITLHHLTQMARCRLLRTYPPFVAGYLTGHQITSPIPGIQAQSYLSADYSPSEINKAVFRYRKNISKAISPRNKKTTLKNQYEILNGVRQIINQCFDESKNQSREVLLRAGTQIKQIGEDTDLKILAIKSQFNERWGDNSAPAPEYIALSNASLVCHWISTRIKKDRVSLNSIRSTINDVMTVLHSFADQPLAELTNSQIFEWLQSIDITQASNTREHLKSTLNQIRKYLIANDIQPGFQYIPLKHELLITTIPLPTEDQINQLTHQLNQGGSLDHNISLFIYLSIYWGLRISEAVNLRVCDIWLEGQATLYLFNTKRTRMRVVVGIAVPEQVISALKTKIEEEEERSGNKAKLISISGHSRKDEGTIREVLAGIMLNLEIPGTPHTFRHYWANRLLWLGFSLENIAHMAHHKSVDTTMEYTHILPALQLKYLQSSKDPLFTQDEHQYLPLSKVGGIIGLSNRTIRKGHFFNPDIQIFSPENIGLKNKRGRDQSFIKAVDLAFFTAKSANISDPAKQRIY